MSGLVTWRPPVMLSSEREHELPAALAELLDGISAASPRPADGGEYRSWARARDQATTLPHPYWRRLAWRQARDARLGADDGLLPASEDRHEELTRTDAALRRLLELEVAWAVLHEDCGTCEPRHVAIAAGLTLADVEQLVEIERERT